MPKGTNGGKWQIANITVFLETLCGVRRWRTAAAVRSLSSRHTTSLYLDRTEQVLSPIANLLAARIAVLALDRLFLTDRDFLPT